MIPRKSEQDTHEECRRPRPRFCDERILQKSKHDSPRSHEQIESAVLTMNAGSGFSADDSKGLKSWEARD